MQDWGLGLGGLRGGAAEGGGIEDKSNAKVEVRENLQLGGKPSWQDQESSSQGMQFDLTDSDETNCMEQCEVVESRDETEHSEEVQGGEESEGDLWYNEYRINTSK